MHLGKEFVRKDVRRCLVSRLVRIGKHIAVDIGHRAAHIGCHRAVLHGGSHHIAIVSAQFLGISRLLGI